MRERGVGTMSKVGIVALIVIIAMVGGYFVLGGAGKTTLSISGSTTVKPLAQTWTKEFMKTHENVRIIVKGGGSGKGVADVKSGISDIGMSSSEELIENEPVLIKHVVAYDGIMVIVNDNFPALNKLDQNGLGRSTLQQIYQGDITNWNQVPGINIDHQLNNYTRQDASGTAEAFANFLGMSQGALEGPGQKGNSGMKLAVEQDKYSLGFIGAAYAFEGNIEEVPIDGNDDGKIEEYERIENYEDLKSNINNYPIKRGLFFATKGEAKGIAETFIDWCRSEGQQYVRDVGYIPIITISSK